MGKITSLLSNQILLTFNDGETAEYVRVVSRRKAVSLEDYIIDNFEWDDTLACMGVKKITNQTCKGCDQSSHCPDFVKKEKRRSK
jgi:hypothetical protein